MDTRINKRLSMRLASTNQSKRSQRRAYAETKKQQQQYDQFKIPCDWATAKNHQLAQRIGKESDFVTLDQVCACCGYQINKTPLSVFCDLKEMNILGVAYPSYFTFIKYSILLILGLTGFSSVPRILSALTNSYCKVNQQCDGDFFLIYSLANARNDHTLIDQFWYFPILYVVFHAIVMTFLRRSFRQLDNEVDEAIQKPEDFCIWVKNIPLGLKKDYDSELLFYFQKYSVPGRQLYIKKTQLAYDLISYEKVYKEYLQKIKEKQKFMKENLGVSTRDFDNKIDNLKEKLDKADDELVDYKKDFQGHMFLQFAKESERNQTVQNNTLTFTERVMLYMFRILKYKMDFIYIDIYLFIFQEKKPLHIQGSNAKNKKKFPTMFWQGKHLLIEAGPDPTDIDWYSLNITTAEKIQTRSLYYVAKIFFVLVLYMILKQTMVFQDSLRSTADDLTKQIICYSIGTVVIILDLIVIPEMMHYFAENSKFYLFSKKRLYKSLGMIILQTICTGFLMFHAIGQTSQNVYNSYGLITLYSIILGLNCAIPIVLQIIDPLYLLKIIKRLIYVGNQSAMFIQYEAQKLMEDEEFQLESRYPYIVKTIWILFFFAPAIPLAPAVYFVSMILYYCLEKFNFIKKRSAKDITENKVSYTMLELLDTSVIFYSLGNLVFSHLILNEYGWGNVLCVVLAFAYIIAPTQQINEQIFKFEKKVESLTYEQCDKDFDTDYDRENPLTSKDALDKWLQLKNFATGNKGVPKFGGAGTLGSQLSGVGNHNGLNKQVSNVSAESQPSQLDSVTNSNMNVILEVPEK